MKQFLLSILLLLPSLSFAQYPFLRSYTVDNGLPSSNVYRAYQDSKGFLWFCTDKGIARFDGYHFESFSTKNGLPNNDVWQCAEDNQKRIWFLTYSSAFYYFDINDNKFYTIPNPYPDLQDSHIWCYVQTSPYTMQAILSKGLEILEIDIRKRVVKRFMPRKIGNQSYPFVNNKTHLNVRMSIGSPFALRAYSEGLAHNIKSIPHVLPDFNKGHFPVEIFDKLITILFEDDKTIYATAQKLVVQTKNGLRQISLSSLSSFKNNAISLLLNTGSLKYKLCVTEKESFILDENFHRLHQFDFINKYVINTIYVDSEENFWFCTKDKGLLFLSKQAMYSVTYNFAEGNSVVAMQPFEDKIIFGTGKGDLYRINPNQTITKLQINDPIQLPVRDIAITKNKAMIAYSGMDYTMYQTRALMQKDKLYTNKIIKRNGHHDLNEPINRKYDGESIHWIDFKTIDTLYANTIIGYNALMMVKIFESNNHYKSQRIFSKVNIPKIVAMHVDNNRKIWVGNSKGIYRLSLIDSSAELFDKEKIQYPLLTRAVKCLISDKNHRVWVGTNGFGLYAFYGGKPLVIKELNYENINAIYLDDSTQTVWVGTNKGVFIVSKINFEKQCYQLKKLSVIQGLPTHEVYCLTIQKNKAWIGTANGLFKIDIKHILNTSLPKAQVPLVIRRVKVNNQDTLVTTHYELEHTQNNLTIEFVALSYRSNKNIRYQYRLLGSNQSNTLWREVEELQLSFPFMPPGTYTFDLRAYDVTGKITQKIQPIIFHIKAPFWQETWFWMIISVIIAVGGIFVVYARIKFIQKVESERTAANKRFAQLELQALQAQMNPHFVFNALSSIQYYILNNNIEAANDYLSRFSRLMRLFLESSRNKYIAVNEECELLEYYISLEQLRFKNRFEYEIRIDNNVPIETEIPAMLIQPFVENAINHGLVYSTNNEGRLRISFQKTEYFILCVVDDNGIGRAKAAELKQKSLKSYQSQATQITIERIQSLEYIEETKVEVNIIDKFDEIGESLGTKVEILIYL
ncbi:MAG: two-component regulator propeller domain-containing protein [Flectobacillus sp.]|uniref:sensor histidine kinase n=1 Tax=Flectobacillus sp. TaxID=50419 RepID=UPI003B9972E6